jgi:transposase
MTLDMFPGKGPLMLGTLLAEIGDVRRFPTGRHVLSYLGWCPYARQSGTKTATHQKMSHAGSRHARHMLWMMAISAVQNVAEYRAYFQVRVAAGKSKMKTLIAVGRKLLGVIYTILKTGVPYDPQRYLQHQATRAT